MGISLSTFTFDEGLILKKADYCIFIGLAFAFIEVINFTLVCTISMELIMIKSHFEQQLLLKYNILSTADLRFSTIRNHIFGDNFSPTAKRFAKNFGSH